ncbi:MAG: oligosaccharide flippase family protein [Bacteroidales bacterium]|nr:oligosaccharide flippase family protein [Bacteroidales bacterium]MDT8373321.1 oligosaccharide flippase family protein [Bacteroidales bacterium]
MGIVRNQTLRGTAWSYLGALLGFVNIILLSPKVFSTGEIGVVQLLLSLATMLAQFSSLGFTNVINRLFPWFRDSREKHNGFLGLAMIITLAGFILALIFLKFYSPYFERVNMERSPLIAEYSFYLPALLLITLLFNLLDNYNKVLYDAVLGTFLKEFLFRVLNFGLICLFWFGVIDFSGYLFGYVVSQGVPLIIIFISLLVRGEISLKFKPGFITPKFRKEIFFLSLFGILTGFSSIILTTLDKVFINRYLGENEVGIYAIATYFAVMIALPGRSVAKISIPFLAESWKNDDLDTIYDLYKRSSINQYAIGLLIFTGLVVNLDNIFRLLPEAYGNSGGVIIMVGLGYLISIIAGINGIILSTSTLYRYQTWLMFILVALFVGTSMIFIPLYGINGAALATMISNIIYNMLGVVVAGRKFGIWPFSSSHLKMTFVAVAAALAGFVLPQMSLVTDILLSSLLVTVVYTAGLYYWRLSDDVNNLIDLFGGRFRGGS